MNVDVPPGYNVMGFGGSIIIPGTRIRMRRESDDVKCVGTVQADGTLDIVEVA